MTNSKLQFLQKSIEEDPRNAFAHFALAREYLKINEREKARVKYDYLIQQFPEYGGTYYHYAIHLLEEDEMESAHRVIDQGIKILKQNNESHLLSELLALRAQIIGE